MRHGQNADLKEMNQRQTEDDQRKCGKCRWEHRRKAQRTRRHKKVQGSTQNQKHEEVGQESRTKEQVTHRYFREA